MRHCKQTCRLCGTQRKSACAHASTHTSTHTSMHMDTHTFMPALAAFPPNIPMNTSEYSTLMPTVDLTETPTTVNPTAGTMLAG